MPRETYVLTRRPDGTHELVPREHLSAWLEKHYPDRNAYPVKFKKVERGSWVWRDGKLIDKRLAPPRMDRGRGLQVIKDIEPYQNIAIDGKIVGGRRQHRDMLKAHNCIEIGTEKHDAVRPNPYWDSRKHQVEVVQQVKRAMGKL